MPDPNENVAGGGSEYLQRHEVQVTTGVCGHQARQQNEAFIKYVTTGLPFVIAKCAATQYHYQVSVGDCLNRPIYVLPFERPLQGV